MRKSPFRLEMDLIFNKFKSKGEVILMKMKKLFCPLFALVLIVSCLSTSVKAAEVPSACENMTITRATGGFSIKVPARTLRQANTSLLLDPGEVVTIKASYSPFSANVDFGLVESNGRFYYVTATDGSIDQSIKITERGEYVFAVRNNSSYSINASGYINY